MTQQNISVWDLPVRLFHWLLVLCLIVAWWSAENREMEIHYYSAMVILGLLVFRLIWGVVGSSTARFTSFVVSPAAVLAFVRSKDRLHSNSGHSPLGGYSVVALLTVLIVQVTTGLFATDLDGLESGPLSYLVSFEVSRSAAEIHEVAFDILLALVILHIASILFYLAFRKRNLIWPMFTGRAVIAEPDWQDMIPGNRKWLVASLIAAGSLVYWAFGPSTS